MMVSHYETRPQSRKTQKRYRLNMIEFLAMFPYNELPRFEGRGFHRVHRGQYPMFVMLIIMCE